MTRRDARDGLGPPAHRPAGRRRDVPGRTWWAAGRTVAPVAPVAVLSVLLGQLHPRYLPDEDRTATGSASLPAGVVGSTRAGGTEAGTRNPL